MPTLLRPIRNNNAYIGIGKQSVGGTSVNPSWFPRWLDGSSLAIDLKAEEVREGDTSRRLSQIIKNLQMAKIKLVCYPRPYELGMLEEAAMGISSDSMTAAAVNTTLANSPVAGAQSFKITANTGVPGSGTFGMVIAPGTSTEESVAVALPLTGTGPYTCTIASTYNNGQGLMQAHTSGDIVRSATTHTLTDQVDGDYFSVEVGLGSLYSANGTTLRIRDCKVDQIKRSSKAGTLLKYEVDFVGITSIIQAGPTTPTFENRNPFLYTQGVWTIDGSQAGDALAVETFDIDQKNAVDTSIQTENLTVAALIFGMLTVEVTYTLVFTNPGKIYQTFFGSSSAPSGTTDAQTMGSGSLTLAFTQPDAFNTVTYTMLTILYTKLGLPTPKADGKHFTMSVTGISTTNSSSNPYIIQTVVTNSNTSSY